MDTVSLLKQSDVFLGTIYSILLIMLFVLIFRKYFRERFMPIITIAFFLKLIFTVLRIFISISVYGEGDTYSYFEGSTRIHQAFYEDVSLGMELLFEDPSTYSPKATAHAYGSWLNREASVNTVCRVGGFFSLFSFNSYLVISLWLAFFSFLGSWMICKSFIKLFPTAKKQICYAMLIPSVLFWGALLSKDAITLFALGYLQYFAFEIIFHRKRNVFEFVKFLFFAYLIFTVKSYVLFVYLGAMFITLSILYRIRIREKFVSYFLRVAFVVATIVIGVAVVQNLQKYTIHSGKIDPDRISEIAENVISGVEVSGSAYTIRNFDLTPSGIFLGSLSALNVTYFRPYPWEGRRVILWPSVFEALILLFYTLYVGFHVKFKSAFKMVTRNKPLFFALLFAIIFGVIAGLFSFTFGTLVRYKIPAIFFYVVLLGIVLCYSKHRPGIQKNQRKLAPA